MSADAPRRYLVAYDIPDDRRRSRLARRLLGYGDRIQYSVFICDLKPARLIRLRTVVSEVVEVKEDSVLVCDLGAVGGLGPDAFSFIGLERTTTPSESIVL